MATKLLNHENELNLSIFMPNEIFKEIKEWTLSGAVKSKQHQEFIYSYYWLITYLWRYTKYSKMEINQSAIKGWLGYNPNEKRINYLIKKNGVLDMVELTMNTRNYPVDWVIEDKELSFMMYKQFDEEDREILNRFNSINYIVKAPMKHIDRDQQGLFWHTDNSHEVSAHAFYECMKDDKLGCSGFYLYGYLRYLEDKAIHFNHSGKIELAHETIAEALQWDRKKISKIISELDKVGLIEVDREVRKNGKWNRNGYKIPKYSFDSQMEL